MHMVETMAYANETPWHGLGTKVLGDLTPEQMLDKSGCNWAVEKRDLFYTANGKKMVAPGNKALVRMSDGKLLDVVGDDWNPLQNAEAFQFFNDFVMSGDMSMDTAGALDGGRRVWALAKVNDAFEVFKGDVIEQYLLFSNPHKYGMSIDVRMTPIRVVCHNTLSIALQQHADRMVKVNHRQVFDADYVKETLGVAKEKLEKYKEAAKFLGSKRYTKTSLGDYFRDVFPTSAWKKMEETASNDTVKKLREDISKNTKKALQIVDNQPGADFGRGTWWQAFNTITYMTDHVMGRSTDTRLTSAWFGINKVKKQKALELAVEYAEAA